VINATPATILVNDGDDAGTAIIGTPRTDLNASAYIRGGKPPVTYAVVVAENATNNVFNMAVDPDSGAITITVKDEVIILEYEDTEDDSFTLTATDADKIKSDPVTLKVLSNRAPTVETPPSDAIVVGTQDDYLTAAAAKAAKAFVCAADAGGIDNKFNQYCILAVTLAGYFDDDHLDADDAKAYSYEVVPDNAAYTAEQVVAADGNAIVVTGISAPTGTPLPTLELKVKALDAGKLPSPTIKITVQIDPRPTLLLANVVSTTVKQDKTTAQSAWNNVALLFADKDAAGASVTDTVYHVKLKDAADSSWLSLQGTEGTGDDAGWFPVADDLDILAPNIPPTAITVLLRARETGDNGQWVTRELAITVEAP
jgi:hypothetical protein